MLRASLRLSGILLASAVALAAMAAPASAAPKLKLVSVDGEATAKEHAKEIEIESFSWGERGAVAPTVTLKRGAPIPVIPFNHAVKSPRDVATGQASGKRQHEPQPLRMGEGSLTVVIPAGTCVPGTRYPMVTLTSDTHSYELQDVTVASCIPTATAKGKKDKAKLDYMIVKMDTILVSG